MLNKVIILSILLGLSPLFFLISLLILIFDGGPILFKQSRLGLRRQPFTIYKFKTMIAGHITPLGHVLRSTGLDELPQLFNIWRGDMAWSGPRPLTPADVNRLGWDSAAFDPRFVVPPGLIGYAQLINVCDQRLSYERDLHTIREHSPGQVFKLLFLGLGVVLLGKDRLKNLL